MPFFTRQPWYTMVTQDHDEESKTDSELRPRVYVAKQATPWTVAVLSAFVVGVCFTGSGLYLKDRFMAQPTCSSTAPTPVEVCTTPAVRREWRTLGSSERADYVNAVKCLSTKPARISKGSAHDDFAYVHVTKAAAAHKSAPFFPWHRYFLHAYENALKDECNYAGVLPYWDWSADVNDFYGAPVWADDSFGGNGTGSEVLGSGACVSDGPFSGFKVHYFGEEERPHCLSRGWPSGEVISELSQLVDPAELDTVLDEPDFGKFALELEHRAHTFMSRSMRGDFTTYTGANDPVFWLHHTNLDRLYAEWQARHNPAAYSGPANSQTKESATLHDAINLGGLLPDIRVDEIISTESSMLCYKY